MSHRVVCPKCGDVIEVDVELETKIDKNGDTYVEERVVIKKPVIKIAGGLIPIMSMVCILQALI